MSRQFAIMTPTGPILVSETGTRQHAVGGVILNETIETPPPPAMPYTQIIIIE
jgi:hypothetical protein